MKINKRELRRIIREEVRNATLQEGVVQDMKEQPEALQRILSKAASHRMGLANRIEDLTREVARLKDRVEAMQRDET